MSAPTPPTSPTSSPSPTVVAVHRSVRHTFSKATVDHIALIAGLGVEGDAHAGTTVQHRSRVARDPTQPNLRQVHLVAGDLHDELRAAGFTVTPGAMGENITTRGIDLLGLGVGARLAFAGGAVVEVMGLRNPCRQLDALQSGLMGALVVHGPEGRFERRAGVMGIVLEAGTVRAGDAIAVEPPAQHRALAPV